MFGHEVRFPMAKNGTTFTKERPGPGRPKGVQNKTTVAAKEAFQLAFDELGGWEGLAQWAKMDTEHRKTFYTLYARLIPMEVAGSRDAPLKVHITREVINGPAQKDGAE